MYQAGIRQKHQQFRLPNKCIERAIRASTLFTSTRWSTWTQTTQGKSASTNQHQGMHSPNQNNWQGREPHMRLASRSNKCIKQARQSTGLSHRLTAHTARGVRGKRLPVLNRDSKKRGVKQGQRGVCWAVGVPALLSCRLRQRGWAFSWQYPRV
jgi:hypothetical protein